MPQNRSFLQSKQQTPPMPPPHPHTVGIQRVVPPSNDDEDDTDICPVCDGECTCNNIKPSRAQAPLSMAELSLQYSSTPPSSSFSAPSRYSSNTPLHTPTPPPTKPSLKIKLTVPPGMLIKKRTAPPPTYKKSSKNSTEMTSVVVNDGYIAPSPYPVAGPSSGSAKSYPPPPPPTPESAIPKRRGRPPKGVVARGDAGKHMSSPPKPKKRPPPPPPKVPKTLKARGALVKKTATSNKRRRMISSDEESELSDVDCRYDADDADDDDDDAESVQFPTFVSASALSSMDSDGSDDDVSSLTSFCDSDSSIEKEEENFILAEVNDKKRVKRELLMGGEERRREIQHSDWVIRPRKKSVGGSDVEMMDVDSEATEMEDDEEEDAPDAEDDEPDGELEGEETDEYAARAKAGSGYVGLATGWSDDEESSFDADLFFANLSDSDSSASSSPGGGGRGMLLADDGDGDESELSTAEEDHPLLPSSAASPREDLKFEVTEGWDGQIVFTNGLSEGQSILDMDFEAHASQFVAETSASPSQGDSDVDMSSEEADAGYEEDWGEGEGDTTDEELVGEDELPNDRAMRLFNLPFSVSAINPLSTVSPAVSPSPRNRIPRGELPPMPADIIAGKVFWDSDSEEYDARQEGRRFAGGGEGGARAGSGAPLRMGVFSPGQETRQAVIDDSHRGVPSPHPRFSRGRGRRTNARFSVVEQFLRRHILPSSRPTSFATAGASLHNTPLLPSADIAASIAAAAASETETAATEPIELDDVLEASFLDPDPADQPGSNNGPGGTNSSIPDGDNRKHLKNLSRWDLISVGAFRQAREAGGESAVAGWGEDPGSSADYGSIMKASPLSAMLWNNKNSNKAPKRAPNNTISPVIMPLRDGDRTPTNASSHAPNYQIPHQGQGSGGNKDNVHQKSRKELRRERKLKRKSYGPVQHQYQHHHHHHHHHPNSKTRSSSSAQRSFLSSVPPFNL